MRGFKTIISAGFLASALALAGCGGGSDDNGMEEMTMEMTPEEKAKAEAEAANKRAEEAEAELAAERERQAEEKRKAEEMAAAEMAEQMQKDAMTLRMVLADYIGLTTDDGEAFTKRFRKPEDFKDKDGMGREAMMVMGEAFEDEYGSAVDTDASTNDIPEIMGEHAKASVFSTSGIKMHKTNGNADARAVFTTSGSYHGVSGTYTCVPATAGTESCQSNVTKATGLTLGGGVWTFEPGNPKDKVSGSDGLEWGWWAGKTDGAISEAGVFYSMATTPLFGIDAIGGTATYKGKALGKYAIHRGPGAANDSGHFTASAELNANFGDSMIKGEISDFIGADGNSRDWSVELQSQTITGAGLFQGVGTESTAQAMTVWTMGGAKADAAGEWVGEFSGQSAEGYTPSTAAGAFEAEYGNIGNMIGAFGAEMDN